MENVCPQCGAPVSADSTTCQYCGAAIPKEQPAAPAAAAAAAAAPAAPQPQVVFVQAPAQPQPVVQQVTQVVDLPPQLAGQEQGCRRYPGDSARRHRRSQVLSRTDRPGRTVPAVLLDISPRHLVVHRGDHHSLLQDGELRAEIQRPRELIFGGHAAVFRRSSRRSGCCVFLCVSARRFISNQYGKVYFPKTGKCFFVSETDTKTGKEVAV